MTTMETTAATTSAGTVTAELDEDTGGSRLVRTDPGGTVVLELDAAQSRYVRQWMVDFVSPDETEGEQWVRDHVEVLDPASPQRSSTAIRRSSVPDYALAYLPEHREQTLEVDGEESVLLVGLRLRRADQ